jgi:hypothetical protein
VEHVALAVASEILKRKAHTELVGDAMGAEQLQLSMAQRSIHLDNGDAIFCFIPRIHPTTLLKI